MHRSNLEGGGGGGGGSRGGGTRIEEGRKGNKKNLLQAGVEFLAHKSKTNKYKQYYNKVLACKSEI